MASFFTNLKNIAQVVTDNVAIILVVVLVYIGGCFLVPGKKAKEIGKESIPWVIVGTLLVIGASVIASDFISKVSF